MEKRLCCKKSPQIQRDCQPLTAAGLQLENQVSYNELVQNLGIDGKTVASYVDILE